MAYSRKILVLVLAAAGCAATESTADGGIGQPMNDTMPPWSMCATDTGGDTDGCGSSSGAGTTTEAPQTGCEGSDECSGNSVCAATFDDSSQAVGEFACQFNCIATVDDSTWCRDDASCCDAGAVCTERGYCVVTGSADTDGSTTTSGGDTDTGTTGGAQ